MNKLGKRRRDIVAKTMKITGMSHVRIIEDAYSDENISLQELRRIMSDYSLYGKVTKIIRDYCNEVLNSNRS